MTPAELRSILHRGESETLELLATFDMEQAAQAVCAMLNGQGGHVIVGADDSGRLLGVSEAQAKTLELSSFLAETIVPVKAMWSVTVVRAHTENMDFLLIDIARGASKPYLISGTIWCRHGTRSVPASADDVHQLIQERIKFDQIWERRPALGIDVEDLDTDEVRRAAKDITDRGRKIFPNLKDASSILEELSLIQAGQLTNAAVVLFGKHPAKMYPQTAVRATVYQSDKAGSELLFDELIDSHLFGAMHRLSEIIQQRIGVTSTFEEGSMLRRDEPTYPPLALREGVFNALVHRDFSSPSGSMSVEFYPDRIAIWNYGSLPGELTTDTLLREHPSLPRNPDIAQVCFLRGLIEKVGRGTLLIAQRCQEAGLESPKWESGPTGTKLTLFSKQATRQQATEGLNQRQLRLLQVLRPGDELKLNEYPAKVEDTSITDRTARTDLVGLMRAGFLKRRGKARSTFYVRTDRPAPG